MQVKRSNYSIENIPKDQWDKLEAINYLYIILY